MKTPSSSAFIHRNVKIKGLTVAYTGLEIRPFIFGEYYDGEAVTIEMSMALSIVRVRI